MAKKRKQSQDEQKETKITKPLKKTRDKINAQYLKLEDEQKELANNHYVRVYNWKKDPKNRDKPSNNVDPSIKKKCETRSKLNNKLRMFFTLKRSTLL